MVDKTNLIGAEAAALEEDAAEETASLQGIIDKADKTAAAAKEDDDKTPAAPAPAPAAAAAPAPAAPAPAPAAATPAAPGDTGTGAAAVDAGTDQPGSDGGDAVAPASAYLPLPDMRGVEEREKELKAQRDDIRSKAKSGDLDRDEADSALDKINDDLADLRVARGRYDSAVAVNLSIYQKEVQLAEVEALKDGIDYGKSPLLRSMWDIATKAIAKDPEAVAKGDTWILREAHRRVMSEIGAARGAPAPAPKPAATPAAAPAVKAAVAARAAATGGVTSLAAAPAAAGGDVTPGGEFAHLESLSGMELEKAIAKLSPDQQDRYLHGD